MSATLRYGLIDNATFTGFSMNTVDRRIALRLLYPKDAIPLSAAVYVNNITGTAPTYRIRIETDSGNAPSGSLYHANATGSFAPTSAGWQTVTFSAAPAALSAGTIYWLVVEYASGTCDGSNNAGIYYQNVGAYGTIRVFTVATSTTAVPSWSEVSSTAQGIFCVSFSGGETYCNTATGTTNSKVWGANRAGCRFTLNFAANLAGLGVRIQRNGSPTDLWLGILDASGNVKASLTVPAALIPTGQTKCEFHFNDVLALAASTTYRFVARTAGESEASNADSYTLTFVDFKDAASSFNGGDFQQTEATADAGPWTDTETRDFLAWLIFDQVNASTGLNTVGDVLEEGNWQADAWSPRIADDAAFQTWVGKVIGRANKYVQWRVGSNYYTAQSGSLAESIFKEAEMQYCQYVLALAAAKVADTSDHPNSAPWLKDSSFLRKTAAEHLARAEELVAPYDTIKGRPGRIGPYFKGVTTREPAVVERFDPKGGVEDDG